MKRRIRVNPKTHLACIPLECVEEGIIGNVDCFSNAITLTLVSSGTSLEDIKSSLKTVIKDIDLRIRLKQAKRSSAEE